MTGDRKLTDDELFDVIAEQAIDDEAERLAHLSDADLDAELAAAGVDPEQVNAKGAELAAQLLGSQPVQAVPQAPPPAEPAKVVHLAAARSKRRPRVWLALVAAAVAAIGGGALIVANQGPPPPPPGPTVVPAPSRPAPLLLADALRDLAHTECQLKKWDECLQHMNEAADEDPAGNQAPAVVAMRKTATDALADELRENEAKTGPLKTPVRDH
jgi:hypothetical protein